MQRTVGQVDMLSPRRASYAVKCFDYCFLIRLRRGVHIPRTTRIVADRYVEDRRRVAPPFHTGEALPSLVCLDYSDSDLTLLMVISRQCHFCTESMPFYRTVVETARENPRRSNFPTREKTRYSRSSEAGAERSFGRSRYSRIALLGVIFAGALISSQPRPAYADTCTASDPCVQACTEGFHECIDQAGHPDIGTCFIQARDSYVLGCGC